MGGYDQRYIRAAKFGAKLKRVKRINFRKQGGEIVGAINLDNWQPVITEAVEQFENGGELEWTPVITLQDGGQVEKWDFETWFNSIPSEYRAPQYDYQMAFNVLDKELLKNHAKNPNQFHLPSVSGKEDKDGRIPFLKLGKRDKNKEVNMEFTEFYENDRGKTLGINMMLFMIRIDTIMFPRNLKTEESYLRKNPNWRKLIRKI